MNEALSRWLLVVQTMLHLHEKLLGGSLSRMVCRQVIAETVAADPETFTEGFLGQANKDYCQWIQKSDKWGGAIELSILAK